MGPDCGPGESAPHSGHLWSPQAAGAELETDGAPQPQNSVFWHHLGVAARGGTFLSRDELIQ